MMECQPNLAGAVPFSAAASFHLLGVFAPLSAKVASPDDSGVLQA